MSRFKLYGCVDDEHSKEISQIEVYLGNNKDLKTRMIISIKNDMTLRVSTLEKDNGANKFIDISIPDWDYS